MPFLLNSRPSDRYRQFIDDDSAQKKVEESRNYVVEYGVVGKVEDNEEVNNKMESKPATEPIQPLPINNQPTTNSTYLTTSPQPKPSN